MSLLQGWKGWRTFKNLPFEWRNLVFFSETGQDWHQFAGLIESLNADFNRKVCYVTGDRGDAGLARRHVNYRSIHIPEGLFLTIFFQMTQADVFVLTMMDLDNLHLKRSVHPVHYVYVFHSMGSTHMVDHANSFDHYDSLFCSGPHQVAEIRKREAMHQLPPKHLFEYGHPRLEQVMREGAAWRESRAGHQDAAGGRRTVILIAPTWGETSIFNVCGAELIQVLLHAGHEVIMRPHYQSNRLHGAVIAKVRERFEREPRFSYVDQMGETDSILRSDLLVSDWSAMAMEYAFGLEKPVLFIDVPRRVRNPDWQALGMEPVESSMRSELGAIVSPGQLEVVPETIRRLLAGSKAFVDRVRALRERSVFRLGHSIPDGAAELARLADQQQSLRLERAVKRG